MRSLHFCTWQTGVINLQKSVSVVNLERELAHLPCTEIQGVQKGPQDFNDIHFIIIDYYRQTTELQSYTIAHFKAEILPLLEMFV